MQPAYSSMAVPLSASGAVVPAGAIPEPSSFSILLKLPIGSRRYPCISQSSLRATVLSRSKVCPQAALISAQSTTPALPAEPDEELDEAGKRPSRSPLMVAKPPSCPMQKASAYTLVRCSFSSNEVVEEYVARSERDLATCSVCAVT